MSSLAWLKPCMSSFMAFESRWISLAKRSRSSFALIVSCVQVRIFSLSNDAEEGCQWEVQTDEGWTPY
jgi:hypothetical protein